MIDSHQHFWRYDADRHSWIGDDMSEIRRDFQPQDLEPLLDANEIDGSVVVQVDQTEDETLALLALSNEYDFIKGVVGWIDLRNPDLSSRLDYFSTLKKLKGFRHIVQGEKTGFLKQADFVSGVRKLPHYGFTYDLLVYHYQLEEALQFLREVPEAKIVIDHIAKPSIATGDIGTWRKCMKEISGLPNVWCKVSGMVTEGKWKGWKYEDFVPYLDVVFEAFGTRRLMYGSDWPVCLVAARYDEQLSIIQKYLEGFSAAEKNQVLGENAERFYNL